MCAEAHTDGSAPGLRSSPRGARLLLAVATALVLLATLTPAPCRATLPLRWCLACGPAGLADVLANILLFLPLGAACAWLGWRALPVLLGAALLSASVETLQLVLPGRDPSVGDVLCNVLGAAVGMRVALACLGLRRRGAPPWAPLAAAAGALIIVSGGGILLSPRPPAGPYYGQWTARLGDMAHYDGRLLGVTLGGMPLPGYDLPDPRLAASLLRAGAELRVDARAGHPPPALAPLFSIFTGDEEEVVLVGLDREDLVFRYRTAGRAWRLDAPDVRLRRAAAGVAAGSPLTVRVAREEDGLCVSLNGRRRCGLGPTVGRIWALTFYHSGMPRDVAKLLDGLFVALLLLPTGLTLRRDVWGLAALATAAATLFLVPPWIELLRATPGETAAACATLALPALIRRYRRDRAGESSSLPTVSARASSVTHRSMRP